MEKKWWTVVVDAYALALASVLLTTGSLALLAQSFHGKERGMAFRIWRAITGVKVQVRW